MQSIAIVNQKGGVGKTTITLGIAEAAAASGNRVLVVDLDPQANASSGLGIWNGSPSIDDVMSEPEYSDLKLFHGLLWDPQIAGRRFHNGACVAGAGMGGT